MENIWLKKLKIEKSPYILIGPILPEEIKVFFKIKTGDYYLLEGDDVKISQVRDFIHWLSLRPIGEIRLAVITSAEKLTIEASNALLKTLEEPPSFVLIVLATSNEQEILPTILSRCQKIRVPAVTKLLKTDNYLDPGELAKMNLFSRFQWVDQIVQKTVPEKEVYQVLTLWQEYFHAKLLKNEDTVAILKTINTAKDLLRTNISVKLLLENLVASF